MEVASVKSGVGTLVGGTVVGVTVGGADVGVFVGGTVVWEAVGGTDVGAIAGAMHPIRVNKTNAAPIVSRSNSW